MNVEYPKNLKEALIMSVPNALTMVLGMVALNLWIYGALTVGHFVRVVPVMFVAAFLLDFVIVGPLVMRIINKFNAHRFMPFLRVALMAGILTFVAPIIEGGHVITGAQYLRAVPRNYIAALLLQIIFAWRIGMYVFSRYKMHAHK